VKTSHLASSVQLSDRGPSPRPRPAVCPAVDGSSYFVLRRSVSDEDNNDDAADDYVQKLSSSTGIQHDKDRCLKYTC